MITVGNSSTAEKVMVSIVLIFQTGKKKRLIMGFGPSASGKTFWTENVIKMMDKADPNFPKVFMSVDGGIIREFSEIYQEVVRNTPKIILGFKNLTQGEKMAPTNGAKIYIGIVSLLIVFISFKVLSTLVTTTCNYSV